MLPNKIVWNHENRKDTYLYVYGDKILHIFSYLDGMTNRFGKTVFTMENMITSCGLVPKTGKKGMTNLFREILINLELKGIIETKIDFNIIKVKDNITCILNMPVLKTVKAPIRNINFFNVTHSNYLEIMDRYTGKLNKLTLLKIYYYINARISRRNIVVIDNKVMSNDIQCSGGKAETFYDSYEAIAKELGIAEDTWCTYIKGLNILQLLFYDNIGIVKKGEVSYTANNVYCINQNEIKEALNQSELYYISNGYSMSGKKTDAETKIISGTKGKIQQEKNRNKDTSKLENKLGKLESNKSKKSSSNDMFKIKTLLDEHEGEVLSSIWDGINDKTSNRWLGIEVSLGLVKDGEDTNDLLVDYEYYKWVVMNYEKSKHDYYVNVVKKHKLEDAKPKHKGLIESNKNIGVDDATRVEELHKFIYDTAKNNDKFKELFIKNFEGINFKTLVGNELDKIEIRVNAFIMDYKANAELNI